MESAIIEENSLLDTQEVRDSSSLGPTIKIRGLRLSPPAGNVRWKLLF
jgi:hypothetical protein